MTDQAVPVELNAQVEADLVAAAAAATTVAAAATAAEESVATEPLAGDGHVDCAELLTQAACGAVDGILPEPVFAAEVIAGILTASHTTVPTPDATAEDSQPEAAATAMASAEPAMTDADTMQGSAEIIDMSNPDSSSGHTQA